MTRPIKNLIALVGLIIAGSIYYYWQQKGIDTVVIKASVDFNIKLDFLPKGDTTQSPFFYVIGSKDKDALPLKSTNVDVDISGVIADVHVSQSYTNASDYPLNAVYVFPASTSAAVYAMEMKIGDKVIHAKIYEKGKARKVFEKAKSEGKAASLLEQDRPNVFQMSVANIQPGAKVEVKLHYTELLVPTEGTYEFIYPTVVPPRYEGETSGEGWAENPHHSTGAEDASMAERIGLFDIHTRIYSGMSVQRIKSPSHDIRVDFIDASTAKVDLASTPILSEKDYVLRYQLKGKAIETGVLLYEGEKEKFFLAMVQPPLQITPNDLPPREYIFIVDVSGSMNGEPIGLAKELMSSLLGDLREEDRFNLMLFESGNTLLFPESQSGSKANLQKAANLLDYHSGSGGTNMLQALQKAMTLKDSPQISRSFVIITDGQVSVEKEAFAWVGSHIGDANFFAFGVGGNVNRYLIEGIAQVGKTHPLIVSNYNDAKQKLKSFEKYIASPVMTGISIDYGGLQAMATSGPHDLFAERPIILYGKYTGTPTGELKVTGYTGQGRKYEQAIDLSKVKPDKKFVALKYLWARNQIKLLNNQDNIHYGSANKDSITALGLKYHLLTDYTSFVAVEESLLDKWEAKADARESFELDGHIEVEQEVELPTSRTNASSDFSYGEPFMVQRDGELVFVDKSSSEIGITDEHVKKITEQMKNIRETVTSDKEAKPDTAYYKPTATLLWAMPNMENFAFIAQNSRKLSMPLSKVPADSSVQELALACGRLAAQARYMAFSHQVEEEKQLILLIDSIRAKHQLDYWHYGGKGELIAAHEYEYYSKRFIATRNEQVRRLLQQARTYEANLILLGDWLTTMEILIKIYERTPSEGLEEMIQGQKASLELLNAMFDKKPLPAHLLDEVEEYEEYILD